MRLATQHSHSRQLRVLAYIGVFGFLTLLVLGAIALLLDWFTSYHFTRLWQQISAAFTGSLLITAAFLVSELKRYVRLLFSGSGFLILVATLDSLDGAQNLIPEVTVLLWLWAAIYIASTIQIAENNHISRARQRFALSLGIVVSVVYVGAALYYVILTGTTGPVVVSHHPLFGLGIILSMLLSWAGAVSPHRNLLQGKVRICTTCGLRNIPERHTCKRCHSELGPIQTVN